MMVSECIDFHSSLSAVFIRTYMSKLVLSKGPRIDRRETKEEKNEIVLFSNDDELCLLSYWPDDDIWLIIGYQSCSKCSKLKNAEANIYWKGRGYVREHSNSYAMLEEQSPWDHVYLEIKAAYKRLRHPMTQSSKITLPIAWCKLDSFGKVHSCNQHFCDLVGINKIEKTYWLDLVADVDKDKVNDLWIEHLQILDREVFTIEFQSLQGRLAFQINPKDEGYIVVAMDTTLMRKIEENTSAT